jgi:hypothetical protein
MEATNLAFFFSGQQRPCG